MSVLHAIEWMWFCCPHWAMFHDQSESSVRAREIIKKNNIFAEQSSWFDALQLTCISGVPHQFFVFDALLGTIFSDSCFCVYGLFQFVCDVVWFGFASGARACSFHARRAQICLV